MIPPLDHSRSNRRTGPIQPEKRPKTL